MTASPYRVGTFAEADWLSRRRMFVKVAPELWATWRDDFKLPGLNFADERCLENVAVLHEGYAPFTPEPIHHGARVVDADDLRLVRKYDGDAPDGHPWALPRGGSYAWRDLAQPVTVISDGSDW